MHRPQPCWQNLAFLQLRRGKYNGARPKIISISNENLFKGSICVDNMLLCRQYANALILMPCYRFFSFTRKTANIAESTYINLMGGIKFILPLIASLENTWYQPQNFPGT